MQVNYVDPILTNYGPDGLNTVLAPTKSQGQPDPASGGEAIQFIAVSEVFKNLDAGVAEEPDLTQYSRIFAGG